MLSLFRKLLPYLTITVVASVCLVYGIKDDGYFFYDDFTAFTFALPRTYQQVVVDSLISKDIDRHKIVGYLALKAMYDTVGLNVDYYFVLLFILHTVNSFLVYRLLLRLTGKRWVSLVVAGVFTYRFYLWWIANIENYLGGLFYLLSINWWLSFVESRKWRYLIAFWVVFPLMVYSYGPTIFLIPALVPITWHMYGWDKLWATGKYLIPLGMLAVGYTVVYTGAPDSQLRFASPGNPYYRPLLPHVFALTQSIYLHLLSSWIPQSSYLVTAIWVTAFYLARRYWLLFIAFFMAIFGNSFFPNHTVFYYLYFPIIFVLIFFAQGMAGKRGWVYLIVFLALFNPLVNLKRVVMYAYYPANYFHKNAMTKITTQVDQALATGQSEIKMSNWYVTPNLHHAIAYGALPFWLSHPTKNDYVYAYSRDTEIFTLIPTKP